MPSPATRDDSLFAIDSELTAASLRWSDALIQDPDIPGKGSPPVAGRDFDGTSVSFAGDWLPQGRVTKTNISKQALRTGLPDPTPARARGVKRGPARPKASDITWDPYGDLYLYLYWKLYGRNSAIAYRLLHNESSDDAGGRRTLTLHIDMSPTDAPPAVEHDPEIVSVRLGRLAARAALSETVKREFLGTLFGTRLKRGVSREELYEYADDLLHRLKNGPERQLLDHFEETEIVILAELMREAVEFQDDFLGALGLRPESAAEPPARRRGRMREAVRMVQLLCLYGPFCGPHVYFTSPAGKLSEFRACFAAWRKKELEAGGRTKLIDHANRVATELADRIAAYWYKRDKIDPIIHKVLPPTVAKKLDGVFPRREQHFLGQYLTLGERLAEVAVHEGKALSFTLFVSSGEAASREVEFVSSLRDAGRPYRWNVKEDDDLVPEDGEVISVLLGNYSFLQERGAVIQASRNGLLIALGRLLRPVGPEQLTAGQTDLYVIQIEKHGDIKVYYKGELVLWRRSARWLVPGMYGETYVGRLTERIAGHFGDLSDRQTGWVGELCRAAWELSRDRVGGACFIIGRSKEGRVFENLVRMTDVFPFAEGRRLLTPGCRPILQNLAVQDGATFVELENGVVYGRRQIAIMMAEEKWQEFVEGFRTRSELWPEWHKIKRWGTRHLNALRTALVLAPDVAILTVSSDGDIHLFGGTGPIHDLTYPGV